MSIQAMGAAVKVAGSQTALAKILKCTPQNVQRMCATGNVPAKHVLRIEAATGVSRSLLSPALYPEESRCAAQTLTFHDNGQQDVGSPVCTSSEEGITE
jgi:DNA-binding transcriptional regulator YdaS (Cro superfamily)